MPKRKPPVTPKDLRIAGELCLAFANTAVQPFDRRFNDPMAAFAPVLAEYADLVLWVQSQGVLEESSGDALKCLARERSADAEAVFATALGLQAVMARMFHAVAAKQSPSPDDIEAINIVLVELLPPRQLIAGATGWNWGFVDYDRHLTAPLWPILTSAADLLVSNDLRWVRQCDGRACKRLFVDRKSRRRRWCNPDTCGSQERGQRSRRQKQRIRRSVKSRDFEVVRLDEPVETGD